MKQLIPFLLLSIISSCSSSRVVSFYVIEEDKIEFSTFSFYDRNKKNLRPQQEELDRLIEHTIYTELVRKGYTKKNYSDVYISYKITLGTSSSSNINRYPNYSSYYYPNYNVNTTHYKEGVLLIEFYSNNDKLIWQGSKSFKVGKSKNTKALLIQYAHEITNSFKPTL